MHLETKIFYRHETVSNFYNECLQVVLADQVDVDASDDNVSLGNPALMIYNHSCLLGYELHASCCSETQ